MADAHSRGEICRSLGIGGIAEAHQLIVAGAREDAKDLLAKGLNAKALGVLGYEAASMEKLGYSGPMLAELGFDVPGAPPPPAPPPTEAPREDKPAPQPHEGKKLGPRALIAKGYHAAELKQADVTLHDCRVADIPVRDLYRVGYGLDALMREFSANELKSVGFSAREMSRFLGGGELRRLGFSATEMRMAGFSVRDLMKFGYNENHIITAGFPLADLLDVGLSRHTSDFRGLDRP